MKTPSFWKEQSFISNCLQPLGKVYALITGLRLRLKAPYKAKCPVICIGNLTAGGTGKTPVSLSIAEILQQMGYKPFFVSRGYGGRIHNVVVNKEVHTPKQVGDEPLLLSECAPTVVNPDRAAAAKLAIAHGADCLVMDDGFQNPGLYKDVSFLVFDGSYGIGNQRVIPAGPLREPFDTGIKRAQAIIILGEDKTGLAKRTSLPVFYGQVKEEQPTENKRIVLAFAGIGHPEKFYNSLQKCGLKIAKTHNFPDHYFYTRAELNKLIDEAEKNDWDIYTTSKDFVKIPVSLQAKIKVLKIKVEWQKKDELIEFLNGYLHSNPK